MVRIIAGTLIRVGTGEYKPEQIPEILAAKDREMAGPTAPAHGLTMIGIEYEDLEEKMCIRDRAKNFPYMMQSFRLMQRTDMS